MTNYKLTFKKTKKGYKLVNVELDWMAKPKGFFRNQNGKRKNKSVN